MDENGGEVSMAEQKKGIFARLFGQQQNSDCCSVKIEEIPEEDKDEASRQTPPEHRSSCCGPAPKDQRNDGGAI